MVQIVTQHPWLLAILAIACLIIGVGIGRIWGNRRLCKAVAQRRSADAVRAAFLKNMSHDVLTPMNAIMGFTQIALNRQPQPQVRRCLEKIDESAQHLLILLRDVLTLSRMEGGKTRCQPEPVDITCVADDALNITRSLLFSRNLSLVVDRDTPKNPCVLADPVLLREVLVSILSNAVKFTHDGGTIRFSSQFRPCEGSKRMLVRYVISDTGIGMSQEFLEHLFEAFSQEDLTARTQYRGVGLGLSIAKRYMEMMGGTIQVTSKKGEGSTFTLELPLDPVPPEKQPKQTQPGVPDLTGVRVLLAEDNDLNAEIAAIQLEDAGLSVTRVRHGGEALVQFTSNPPGTYDVILMDIMMPEMNGWEATKAIRALSNRPDGQTIPIIAMTANAFAEDVEVCLDAGMNAHLAKPIVISQVLKTIARNLDP